MSTVVSTPIVDKNGKQTTVKKKVGEYPKPAPRPIPVPLARQQTVDPEQRSKDAVRDLLTRLNLGGSGDVAGSDIKEVSKNVYAVSKGDAKVVAFDEVQVGAEVVSGVVTMSEGKVGGNLHLGNGTSNQTDSRGYAILSSEAAVETQMDAVKIALPYL